MDTTPEKIGNLPQTAGVYLFSDSHGKILYVGKAKNVRSRVSSYFMTPSGQLLKTQQLVPQIARIRTIQTRSEFEALLLEAKLIHSHQPKYNSLAKDDKSPLYLTITNEKLPHVSFVRKPKNPQFGPFQSPRAVRSLLRRLRSVVPYCTQKQRTGRACFYTQLGLCGPCPSYIEGLPKGNPRRRELTRLYRRNMRRLTAILSGKTTRVLRELESEIRTSAKDMAYEKAAEAKEQRDALLSLLTTPLDPSWYTQRNSALEDQYKEEEQALRDAISPHLSALPPSLRRIECYDISNLYGTNPTGSMVVAGEGIMDPSSYRRFHIRGLAQPNDVGMMREVLTRRLKHEDWPAPDLILVDGGKSQVAAAVSVLTQAESTIPVIGLAKQFERIVVPQGRAFTTVTLRLDNPALHLLRRIRDEAHRFALSYHRKLRANTLGLR